MFLAMDCETTGLPNFSAPSDDPSQPHIVELALILLDEAGVEQSCASLIVKPDGWTIPADMTAIHGIDDRMAVALGFPAQVVMGAFLAMRAKAHCTIAHNHGFDARMIRIELMRLGWTREQVKELEEGETFCTMRAARPVMNMPGNKSPKLSEAMLHFYGATGIRRRQHRAMSDAQDAADLWRKLRAGAAK